MLSLVHNIDATQHELDVRIEFGSILVLKVGDAPHEGHFVLYCEPTF